MGTQEWRDEKDVRQAGELVRARAAIREQIARVIVGQDQVVEELLTSLFTGGHCLLIGVPGLAKTLLVSTLAQAVHLSFNRVQFTPDLMPSDITGTEVLEEDAERRRSFRFLRGPVFTNVLLADEINRTPPKTQAALLQAMQEYQVSAGGQTHALERPFFVLATQNPIEQEGTYPLPEAQLDRFMFYVTVDYPSAADEMEIVRSTTVAARATLQRILTPAKIRELQALVLRVPAADHVVKHAVDLVRKTRPGEPGAPAFVKENVSWGAGPRASQYLVLGAKSRAILDGRMAASVEDVRAIARNVLVHRIIPNFRAESEGLTSAKIVDRLLEETPT